MSYYPLDFVVLKSGNEKKYMLILYYIPQSWVIENINQLEFAIFSLGNR